jgi:type IV secretory pathway VirB2 component (pilin)
MQMVLFWLFMVYDTLFFLPFAWLKVVIGLGTGLLIRGKVVGLLACLVGDGLIYVFAYLASPASKRAGASGAATALVPETILQRIEGDLMFVLMMAIIIFNGVLWWIAGRVLRWGVARIRARWMPAQSAP